MGLEGKILEETMLDTEQKKGKHGPCLHTITFHRVNIFCSESSNIEVF